MIKKPNNEEVSWNATVSNEKYFTRLIKLTLKYPLKDPTKHVNTITNYK